MRPSGYLFFVCGQFGVMALTRFFFQWVLRFAGQTGEQNGAPLFAAAAVGGLFLAFRIFDGVTDPIAGVACDAWVKRGHQRRSLLWIAFAVPSLGLAMVFAPGLDTPTTLRWVWLTAGMFTFFVGYTAYVIPYWSLVDDYAQGDPATRARLSNLLGVGVLIATGFGFVVSPSLVEHLGYTKAALLWCVPCAALMVLPYFASPSGIVSPAGPSSPDGPLLEGFRLAFSDRRFRAVICLFAGGQMSFTVMTAAAPFIAVELLGGTDQDVATLLGPFLGTAVLGFLGVPRLATRLGWERAVLIATVLLGVAYGGSGLLGAPIVGSATTTALVVFATAGPMASVLLGLEGEAITRSAAVHATEVTSVYFGVYNFVVKSLNGVALLLTGLLAGSISELGTMAVRGMGFMAGGLLFLAVLGYLLLRPRSE